VEGAEKRKNALQETKERRKKQSPVVFQLKLQNLSKKKKEDLKRAFLEAKWFYNRLVSDTQRLNFPANKVQEVEVKVADNFENRKLLLLGSQIKQEIADRLKDNLRSLSQLKKKGHKVGALMQRYEPKIKECFACGELYELSLGDRVLECRCGRSCDRDLNASPVILRKGLGLSHTVGLDRDELTPLRMKSITQSLASSPYIRVMDSLEEEALL